MEAVAAQLFILNALTYVKALCLNNHLTEFIWWMVYEQSQEEGMVTREELKGGLE